MWGWTFTADAARAPEFLDLHQVGLRGLVARDAAPFGLTLTGSGATGVRTPPLFLPWQRVAVTGAGGAPFVVRADARGAVSFSVDLGPAHTLEEGTAVQTSASAATPSYFTTRDVRLAPLGS